MEKSHARRDGHVGILWSDLRGPSIRGVERDRFAPSGKRIDGGLLGMLET